MTSLCWISSHTRMQRSQRMHAECSTAMTREGEGLLPQAVAPAEGKEEVVAGCLLAEGFSGIVGQQELGESLPAALDLLRVRLDRHAIGGRPRAPGGEDALAHVHHAHAADPYRAE